MKLYKFDWGPAPRRVLIYLAERGIADVEMIDVDVIAQENRSDWFLAINPAGTVPLLTLDDGHVVRQSGSIIQYLEATRPAGRLSGGTPEAAAAAGDLTALVEEAYQANLLTTLYGSPLLEGRRPQSMDVARTMRTEAVERLHLLEEAAGEGEWLGGAAAGTADIAFFAFEQFYRELYRLPLPEDCVRLEAIYRRFSRRPTVPPLIFPDVVIPMAPIPGLSTITS